MIAFFTWRLLLDPNSNELPSKAVQSTPLPEASGAKVSDDLNAIAQEEASIPLWKDFAYFLLHNKKWWLLPIIVILIILGLVTALSSTAIAPFIYTVF
jgi:hypothetical protein